jgi:Secretion system C-terminal sorting domain
MKKIVLSLSLLVAGLMSFAQVADQPNVPTPVTAYSAFTRTAATHPSQSFTAGVSGKLEKINLYLSAQSVGVLARIQIFEGSVEGGNLASTALVTSLVSVPVLSASLDTTRVLFTDLELVKDTKYTIKLSVTTNSTINFGISKGTSYDRGSLSVAGAENKEDDMHFKTFMSIPTGLFVDVNVEKLALYPNPSNGSDINFTSNQSEVTVFNVLGERVLNLKNVSSFSVQGLENGSYSVHTKEGVARILVSK